MKLMLLVAGAAALAGCDPSLPPVYRAEAGAEDAGAPALRVSTEPPGPLDAAPPALRLRFAGGVGLEPGAVALVRGELGPGQLREIARGELSAALRKRLVPALVWREGDEVVLAPTVLLEPDVGYSAAAGEQAVALTVAGAAEPVLPRVWPPEGSVTTAPFAVWCGDAPAPLRAEVPLAPEGPLGTLVRGVVAGGAGARCLRLEAAAGPPGSWVPPLRAAGVALAPGLLQTGGPPSTVPALACQADEVALGPACAHLADDRLHARAPGVPLLWAIAGAGVDAVFTTDVGAPFTLAGLPPSTSVLLDVAAIDEHGTVLRMLTTAVTAAPMPHPVLNEVLANPFGPEPAAEWVEIVNDGRSAVELGGWVLSDGGGSSTLPPATLPAGAFALVVNDAWPEEPSGADPAPAPGTLVLRVPHLGKNGLANGGEPLALADPEGHVVSRFPATPKPKAGLSVARRAPSAPDDAPSAFARATPTPGSPNVF